MVSAEFDKWSLGGVLSLIFMSVYVITNTVPLELVVLPGNSVSTHVYFFGHSDMLIPTEGNKLALVPCDDSNQEAAGDWVQTLSCLDTGQQ